MRTFLLRLLILNLGAFLLFPGVKFIDSAAAETVTQKEQPCAEYSRLFRLISGEILTVPSLREQLGFIDPMAIAKNAKDLECEISTEIPRTAWSFSSKTQLNNVEWLGLSILDKLRLVVHEIAVMAHLEKDGQYYRSEAIASILTTYSRHYADLLSAETIFRRGSLVTFVNPFVLFQGQRFSIGYQLFADVDHAYIPESIEERNSKLTEMHQTILRSTNLQFEFCRLQGLQLPDGPEKSSYRSFSLRAETSPLDPQIEVVPSDFKLVSIKDGEIELQKLKTLAAGDVLYFEAITCVNKGGSK